MNPGEARTLLDRMEAWLLDPSWQPESEALAQWNARFQAAKAQSSGSDEWPELAARAHAAGLRLDARIAPLVRLRDEIKAELEVQERGNRALKGYGAGVR